LQFTSFQSVQEKFIFPSSDLQKTYGRSSSLYSSANKIWTGLGTSIIKISMGLGGIIDMNNPEHRKDQKISFLARLTKVFYYRITNIKLLGK